MLKKINPLLNETFVFRPIEVPREEPVVVSLSPKYAGHGLLRYAEGKWIPDDGEPDLAFIERVFAYGVSVPFWSNILWSWRDLDLSRSYLPEKLHRNTNGWHYQTANNTHWRDYRWSNDKHPNTTAYNAAIHKCADIHGCANGRTVYLTQDNVWIQRGLLWVKSTMQPVKPPEKPVCFLCLNNGKGHLLEALESKEASLKEDIEYYQGLHDKAEIDAIDYKDTAEHAENELKEIERQIAEVKA